MHLTRRQAIRGGVLSSLALFIAPVRALAAATVAPAADAISSVASAAVRVLELAGNRIDQSVVDLARVQLPEFAEEASDATKRIQGRPDVSDLLDDPPALRKRLLELSFEPEGPVSVAFDDVQGQIAQGQSAIAKTLEAHPEWRIIKFQDPDGSDFFQNVPVGVESVDRRRPRDRITPARAETDAVLQAFEDLGDIALVQPDDLAPRAPLSVSRTDG